MWQAMLALGVAAIGFFGVVLGAVVTGYVTLRQTQLATQREREAQQVLREQERRDRHDAFQRETLLAAQDAVMDVWKAVLGVYDHNVSERDQHGSWPKRPDSMPLPPEWSEADGRLIKLAARVFDSKLSALLKEFQNHSMETLTAETEEEAFTKLGQLGGLMWLVNSRVSVLLPSLF